MHAHTPRHVSSLARQRAKCARLDEFKAALSEVERRLEELRAKEEAHAEKKRAFRRAISEARS